jgi:hypothetical protein
MQRTGQRPCADVSALRRAGHRHHQTEAESGTHRLGIRLAFVTVMLIIVWIILHRFANQTLAPLKAIQQQQQSH